MEVLVNVFISYLIISFLITLLVTVDLVYKDIKSGEDFTVTDALMVIFVLIFSWWIVWFHIREMKIFSKLMSFTLIKGKNQ